LRIVLITIFFTHKRIRILLGVSKVTQFPMLHDIQKAIRCATHV
jgi:hypothetical protein